MVHCWYCLLNTLVRGALLLVSAALPVNAVATVYSLPEDGSSLIGQPQLHWVKEGEYFDPIARQYGVGMLALMASNPGVDPFLPEVGTRLVIPTQMILPDLPRKGIIINLAELRLYYFHQQQVYVFPIAIGRIGHDTPLGKTSVIQKRQNPPWIPPESIREQYAQRGIILPKVVPAGPENPLGNHAIRLGFDQGQYLIHGTNKDNGVGFRASAGCIRMWPEDVELLFSMVKKRDPVWVINQTEKLMQAPSGEIWMETHSPATREDGEVTPLTRFQRQLLEANHINVDWVELQRQTQLGLPEVVGWP